MLFGIIFYILKLLSASDRCINESNLCGCQLNAVPVALLYMHIGPNCRMLSYAAPHRHAVGSREIGDTPFHPSLLFRQLLQKQTQHLRIIKIGGSNR